MLKLNTHDIYDLANRVHPLTQSSHRDGMVLNDIFWSLVMARQALRWFARGDSSFFLPSLKRAAEVLLNSIQDIGVPDVLPWESDKADPFIPKTALESWQVEQLAQSVKDFETVVANELPGLATYYVLQKGIYSTDDLLTHADHHLPDVIRRELPAKSSQDICQAGKCLAFELGTASAFHMWRALETVMDAYHVALTGDTFEAASVTRNWWAYIKGLEQAGAEKKITLFLDHIREEYRNPISHPSETVEIDEALSLFSAGLSAINQAVKATVDQNKKKKLPRAAVPVGALIAKPAAP